MTYNVDSCPIAGLNLCTFSETTPQTLWNSLMFHWLFMALLSMLQLLTSCRHY